MGQSPTLQKTLQLHIGDCIEYVVDWNNIKQHFVPGFLIQRVQLILLLAPIAYASHQATQLCWHDVVVRYPNQYAIQIL